jgi:hypothetical protein
VRNLAFYDCQLPAARAFLAKLKPRDELTYRLALAELLPACSDGDWGRRRSELLAELAPDEAATERFMRPARTGDNTLRMRLAKFG